MKYIVGAYVASPTLDAWDSWLETEFYNELKKIPQMGGLEHPFYGRLHRDDDEWFLKNIDPKWDFVLTCIPGVMDRLKENPRFGLASNDEESRRQAVAYHADALKAVEKLNLHLGRKAVIAVQIQSAPSRKSAADSSAEALARSLKEIESWNWQDAKLVIEHVDAYLPAREPVKGFLTVDEELAAIRGTNVGLMVNWGRSAIEGRSAETPLRHIQKIRSAGALKAVMFSGVTDTNEAYGVWKDTHMPPASNGHDGGALPQDSLMTERHIRACIDAAGRLDYLGAKVMLWPKGASLEARIAMIRETLMMLS